MAVVLWPVLPVLAAGWSRISAEDDNPQLWWAAAALLGVAGYLGFLAVAAKRPRRMVLLIIDDLDRCDGTRVVRLLETVHTVLRERAAPRRLTRWRAPAPFAVLVVANGAWIRDAFSKHYETFDHASDTDAVHDLGADFLQKIFDHSVLVPGLSPRQTEELVHVVAGSRYHRPSVNPPPSADGQESGPDGHDPGPGDPAQTEDQAGETSATAADPSLWRRWSSVVPDGEPDESPPDTPPGARTTRAPNPPGIASATGPATPASGPLPDSQSSGAMAARADLGANAPLLINHLLTRYHPILPPNPRLIIRVATSWAMLRAVGRSLGLEVDAEPANELLVRAAVIWVRFPVLVVVLLDADQPPAIDPAGTGDDPRWLRRDVQQVLHLNDGTLLNIEDLARYYGRFFHAPVQSRPPT